MSDRQANIVEAVSRIYAAFEKDTAAFRSDAACTKGCAYCCSDAGRIDITTMEGLIIRDAIDKMPRPRQAKVKKDLARDMKKRESGQQSIFVLVLLMPARFNRIQQGGFVGGVYSEKYTNGS